MIGILFILSLFLFSNCFGGQITVECYILIPGKSSRTGMELGKDMGCQEKVSSDLLLKWQTEQDSLTSRLYPRSGPQKPSRPVFNVAEWIVRLHLEWTTSDAACCIFGQL